MRIMRIVSVVALSTALLMSEVHTFFFPNTFHSLNTVRSLSESSSLLRLSSSSPSSEEQEEARRLQAKAEQLRQEIASIEQVRDKEAEEERQQEEAIVQEKKERRNRYSAVIPILKGDGRTVMEQVDFPPRCNNGESYITSCEVALPMGILLGESTGEDSTGARSSATTIMVDEVAEGSNGESAGIRVGDIVRACTACQAMMKAPTWQILAGGIGMPETRRFIYDVDGRPLEEVMEAIGSNRMDPEQRPVVLVLERTEE